MCFSESTPHGLTTRIASATFSRDRPHVRITGRLTRLTTARLISQSCVLLDAPLPGNVQALHIQDRVINHILVGDCGLKSPGPRD